MAREERRGSGPGTGKRGAGRGNDLGAGCARGGVFRSAGAVGTGAAPEPGVGPRGQRVGAAGRGPPRPRCAKTQSSGSGATGTRCCSGTGGPGPPAGPAPSRSEERSPSAAPRRMRAAPRPPGRRTAPLPAAPPRGTRGHSGRSAPCARAGRARGGAGALGSVPPPPPQRRCWRAPVPPCRSGTRRARARPPSRCPGNDAPLRWGPGAAARPVSVPLSRPRGAPQAPGGAGRSGVAGRGRDEAAPGVNRAATGMGPGRGAVRGAARARRVPGGYHGDGQEALATC